jgi:manganese efflux pump family protein
VARAERHFPLAIVVGHGLLAATTLVVVLLAVLGVGGS